MINQTKRKPAPSGLTAQLAFGASGLLLAPTFIFTMSGFPDSSPHMAGIAVMTAVYAMFCATEAYGIYLALAQAKPAAPRWVRIVLSVLFVLGLAAVQAPLLVLAMVVWPILVAAMLFVMFRAALRLRSVR